MNYECFTILRVGELYGGDQAEDHGEHCITNREGEEKEKDTHGPAECPARTRGERDKIK